MTDTTIETAAPTLDTLAPYPETAQEATADALIKYVAVGAYARHITVTTPPDGASKEALRAWQSELAAFCSEYAVVSLLRFLQGFHKDVADDAAYELWAEWQDGGVMPELLWDWLHAYKVDPELVERLAKEAVAKAAEATS